MLLALICEARPLEEHVPGVSSYPPPHPLSNNSPGVLESQDWIYTKLLYSILFSDCNATEALFLLQIALKNCI